MAFTHDLLALCQTLVNGNLIGVGTPEPCLIQTIDVTVTAGARPRSTTQEQQIVLNPEFGVINLRDFTLVDLLASLVHCSWCTVLDTSSLLVLGASSLEYSGDLVTFWRSWYTLAFWLG